MKKKTEKIVDEVIRSNTVIILSNVRNRDGRADEKKILRKNLCARANGK